MTVRGCAESPCFRRRIDLDVADKLHSLCGVYTRPEIVKRVLTHAGWTHDADLSSSRLLEPGAGDGSFLEEAVKRLIQSFIRRGLPLTVDLLRDRILAYEIVPCEASAARVKTTLVMRELGIHHSTARACAQAWIRNEDFLLARINHGVFTHIVGNPPYVRWSKLPDEIKTTYREILPKFVTKGDLILPFLHRSFEALAPKGRCVLVCSDRWRYTAYGADFRRRWFTELKFDFQRFEEPTKVFDRNVNVQAELLTAVRGRPQNSQGAQSLIRGKTLKDMGCTIQVGPALGITEAFVLGADEEDVEHKLTHPWIHTKDVRSGTIHWSGRRVISPFDHEGNLIDLEQYPLFERRVKRFEDRLRSRYIVRTGSDWYRTIQKIQPSKWSSPKLLIPEMAKFPRIAMDYSGSIPSHGIYVIFHCDNEIEDIYDRLKDGKLAEYLKPIAPVINGGYTRCYRHILEKIEIRP